MAETTLTTQTLYSGMPLVRCDEQHDEELGQLLWSMSMTESEGGLSNLELLFSNWVSRDDTRAGPAFEKEEVLALGKRVSVYAGSQEQRFEIFSGVITGLEARYPAHNGTPELCVLAEDALQTARLRRRTASYENPSIADLTQQIAQRCGLRAVVAELADPIGPQAQINESDLAFLRRVLQRHDADLQVVGGELHVAPRKSVMRSELELELGGQLHEVRFLADLAQQATEVSVTGFDVVRGQRVEARSRGRALGPGQGRTGAELLRQALGERSEHLHHLVASCTEEAQALADAAFDQRARSFVQVSGTAQGNPRLRVGSCVRLRTVGGRFDGAYYVVRACHRYDPGRGYQTEFEAESAYLGEA